MELKPCRHCGYEAKYHYECDMVKAVCSNYNRESQMVGWFDEPEDAAADWNKEPPAHKYTVEELKELENQPIWIVEGKGRSWTNGVWVICNGFEWRQGHTTDWITFGNFGSLACKDYDKTWLAYDRPPEEG